MAAHLFRFLSPEVKRVSRMYENSLEHFHRLKNQRNFLTNCSKEHVIPRSLEVPVKMTETAFHPINQYILADRIKSIKQEINIAAHRNRYSYNNLRLSTEPHTFNRLVCGIRNITNSKKSDHSQILDRKLNHLCRGSLWNKYSNRNNIHNISSHNLTENEIVVLGLGMSFNLEPRKDEMLNTIASLEKLLKWMDNSPNEKQQIRGMIPPLLHSYSKEIPLLPKRLNEAMRDLKNNPNIKILPADKGGKVVVMDQQEYLIKAHRLLSDKGTYEKLLQDPFEQHNKNVRAKMRQHLKNHEGGETIKKLSRENPTGAYFYGVPKTHKDGTPLRPVVSTCGTITWPLARWLSRSLSNYVGIFSPSHVKNSQEFKQRLNDFARNNDISSLRMISFDVKSLFTNVPTEGVINFIESKIDEGIINPPISKYDFIQLLKLCVNDNFFEFNKEFYRQKNGIAMGSPLSPVLANIYMEYFESTLLPTLNNQPVFYVRYIDDIFALVDMDQNNDIFVGRMNTLAPTIQFTYELEHNGELPFLECRVMRHTYGFKFDVYRKPSNAGMHLHFFSHHPKHVKRAVLFGFLLRAYRISDREFLQAEIEKICLEFKAVGYPEPFIKKIHSDVRRKHFSNETEGAAEVDQRKKNLSLPLNEFTRTYAQPILRHHNIRVNYKATNTLRKKLVRTGPDRRNTGGEVGVYKIPCNGCNRNYVGQCGRPFNVRLSEHKRYANGNPNTYANQAVAVHQNSTLHTINWPEAKIIYESAQLEKRLTIESLLIQEVPNFNLTEGPRYISNASKEIIINNLSNIKKLCPNR